MNRFARITIGAVLAFIAVLFILPYAINWEDYKGDISEQVKEKTGRDLTIKGPLKVSFLPSPRVSLEEVTLSNMAGGTSPYMAQVKKIQVRLALLPLFTGNLVLRARIDSPDVRLEQKSSGSNWDLLKDPDASKTQEEKSVEASEEGGMPFNIQVDELRINKGHISYRDSGAEPQEFKNLNATISLDSLQGPFTIDASVAALGHPGKLKATVDSLDADTPVHANMTWQGHSVEAQGSWNHEALNFTGSLAINTAPVPSLGVVAAKANLSVDLKSAKITNLSITSAQGKAKGSADVRWAPSLLATADLSGLPGQTSLKITHKDKAKGPHLVVVSKALKSLLPSLPAGDFKAELTLPLAPLEKSLVEFQGAKISWGPAKSTLKGSFSYKDPKDYRSDLIFNTSDLSAWARLFDLAEESAGSLPASITINTSGPLTKLSTKLNLSSGGNSLKVSGDISPQSGSHAFQINASIPDAKKFLGPLGIGSDAISALTLEAKASLGPNETKLNVGKASLSTGRANVQLTSDLSLKLSQKPKAINGSVTITGLTFKKPESSSEGASDSASDQTSGSPLSKETLDLKALKNLNLSLAIKASQLPANDLDLRSLDVQLKTRNGKLELSPLQASVAKGQIQGTMSFAPNGNFKGDISLKSIQIQSLLMALSGMDEVTGTLEGNLNLTAQGKSLFNLASSLNGSLNLHVLQGNYHGFDLSDISKQLKNINNLTGVLGLLAIGASGGDTPFQKLGGSFNISKGVISPNNVSLEAEAATAELTGNIDLPGWKAALEAQLKFTDHPKFPGVGVDIQGPLNNVSFSVNTDALKSHLAGSALSGLLGGVLGDGDSSTSGAVAGAVTGESGPGEMLGDVLGNVLGGGSVIPTPQGVVGNVVGGLLGGIFGGDEK
ncbi:MAG: AsmA family protein [bacterium]|nr:AsmA family protein [bacterium]